MKPDGGFLHIRAISVSTRLFGGIAVALLASTGVLWLATGEGLVVLAYALGLVVLLAGGLALQRLQERPENDQLAVPDWSVTVHL